MKAIITKLTDAKASKTSIEAATVSKKIINIGTPSSSRLLKKVSERLHINNIRPKFDSLSSFVVFADNMALQLSRCALGNTRLHFLKSKNIVVCIQNSYHGRNKIGTREVVGFGVNGEYSYNDRMDFPCPAIRFKEVKGDLVSLKEKEKGDWKQLSIEEKKKCMYFTSFKT